MVNYLVDHLVKSVQRSLTLLCTTKTSKTLIIIIYSEFQPQTVTSAMMSPKNLNKEQH